MTETPKAVVLFSGGMDSTTLLFDVISNGYQAIGLSVHYGQKHKVELVFAAAMTKKREIEHHVVDLAAIKGLIAGSALTGSGPIPEGHYAAENMAQTVVPNRNAILLSLAYGLATSIKAAKVCTAVHAGDHAIYPDCRPGFIKAFEEMEQESITREIYGIRCPQLYAPFLNMSKADIVKHGASMEVPWEETWSCYNGDLSLGQCGRCGTCVERIEAFSLAGVLDPTRYQDKSFAEEVLARTISRR